MGGKDASRQPRLGGVRDTPPGWIRLATCTACGNQGVLPAAALIRKHGELHLLEFALIELRCSACNNRGATASMVRLCDPGCPRRTMGGCGWRPSEKGERYRAVTMIVLEEDMA